MASVGSVSELRELRGKKADLVRAAANVGSFLGDAGFFRSRRTRSADTEGTEVPPTVGGRWPSRRPSGMPLPRSPDPVSESSWPP